MYFLDAHKKPDESMYNPAKSFKTVIVFTLKL